MSNYELVPENTMVLTPKLCSFPLQRYGCCKTCFCMHVNGDINFDKLVHENMFLSVMTGFHKSGNKINGGNNVNF